MAVNCSLTMMAWTLTSTSQNTLSGDTSRIQWAAFYSDCIHEVKPIVEGHRVTITYSIIALEWLPRYHQYTSRYTEHEDAVSLQEHFECSEESPSLTTKALTNVKTELEKIQSKTKRSPSKVGFLLKHKYTTKGLQTHLLKVKIKDWMSALLIRSGSAN